MLLLHERAAKLRERRRERPRDLCLREREPIRDVLLREVAVEPEGDDLALASCERSERVLQRQPGLAAPELGLGDREQRGVLVERRRRDRSAPRLMTAELADDRRDGVRTEVASAFDVEPVDRLDQPDRTGLNEIFGLLGGTREAAGQRPDERQVPLDRLLPRRPVVGAVVPRKQLERVDCRCQSRSTPTSTSYSTSQSHLCE